ncbi:MAG: hypothetical protein ACHBN1_19045 [Heteroscytonema crispum UTEX LB 1556]
MPKPCNISKSHKQPVRIQESRKEGGDGCGATGVGDGCGERGGDGCGGQGKSNKKDFPLSPSHFAVACASVTRTQR